MGGATGACAGPGLAGAPQAAALPRRGRAAWLRPAGYSGCPRRHAACLRPAVGGSPACMRLRLFVDGASCSTMRLRLFVDGASCSTMRLVAAPTCDSEDRRARGGNPRSQSQLTDFRPMTVSAA